MSLYVFDLVLRLSGIRGHIPQNGDFDAGPNQSALAAGVSRLLRVLAAAVLSVGFLSLALWAAVWLAIKLL